MKTTWKYVATSVFHSIRFSIFLRWDSPRRRTEKAEDGAKPTLSHPGDGLVGVALDRREIEAVIADSDTLLTPTLPGKVIVYGDFSRYRTGKFFLNKEWESNRLYTKKKDGRRKKIAPEDYLFSADFNSIIFWVS
ncbi:MAG TPA: hypothetical protein VJ969_09320 [Desulfopila sp.]|nr:hypothetical protein [Desulfopila sp.]